MNTGKPFLRSSKRPLSLPHAPARNATGIRSLASSLGTRCGDANVFLLAAVCFGSSLTLHALRCLPSLGPLGCFAILDSGHRSLIDDSNVPSSPLFTIHQTLSTIPRFHALRLRMTSCHRGLHGGGHPIRRKDHERSFSIALAVALASASCRKKEASFLPAKRTRRYRSGAVLCTGIKET